MEAGVPRRIANLGAAVLGAGEAALALWGVYVATWAGVIRRASRRKLPAGVRDRLRGEVARQMYSIGNRSLVFLAVTLGFIGMVIAFEACLQLSRVTGDLSQVGGQYLRLVVSDLAATLTGLMLATRVGAGIAAEIGSMKVTEQIDALRMTGVAPVDYLIVPRFLASLVMTLVLSALGGAVMFATGGLTAKYSFAVNPHVFFDASMVRGRHVVLLIAKAIAFGAAIPVIAGFCGLRARGSSEGVGRATTAAVIGGSFAVIVLDFAISAAALLVTGGDL
jgi:phospholipid/cholesterol/gamma-HCH transport system permease protein